ncbi:MAG TPA: TIGR03619 family F420-dependent LLM class oxidoreductase [Mycobacteriales bacterium]|nr:TIGR03619 family F420-dependent LLM class oxidoreductase [Mycobacteriales bacterium]
MKFGIHLPQAGKYATGRSVVDVAQAVEDRGFDSVWLYDHLFTPEQITGHYPGSPDGVYRFPLDAPYLDALAMLGAIAASTSRVRFGTRVLLPLLRNPALLAKELAGIDELAGGRLLLGCGAGWMREEYDAVGVPFEGRGARLDEHITLMRQVWSGERKPFNGQYYQHVAGSFLPAPPRGSIPVLFGGSSEAALRRVARSGDGWCVIAPPVPAGGDPVEVCLPAVRAMLERLRAYCEQAETDYDALLLVADASFDAPDALLQGYADLGIDICDLVSLSRPSRLVEQIDQFAQRVGTEL